MNNHNHCGDSARQAKESWGAPGICSGHHKEAGAAVSGDAANHAECSCESAQCSCGSAECTGEHGDEADQRRTFQALYLLPYGYSFNSERRSLCDGSGRPLTEKELQSWRAEMVVGLGALQPLYIVAQLADGTFDFADADEVDLQTSNGQEVGFYYESEYGWTGVEGREYTKAPVTVTATWVGDGSLQASAAITVAPIQELLWMPALDYAIADDGQAFLDTAGQRLISLPKRATLKVGQAYALQAVARYSDERYRVMSRTELEFVVLEDAVSVDYDADNDVYLVKVKSALAEPVEIMLVALASDELMGSFFIACP